MPPSHASLIIVGHTTEAKLDIRTAQDLIMQNKREKGFSATNIPYELCLLQGEVTEFFEAWRHKRSDAGEELADVGRAKRGSGPAAPRSAGFGRTKEQTQAIREWARQNGYAISERGRVPSTIIEAFESAHTGKGSKLV